MLIVVKSVSVLDAFLRLRFKTFFHPLSVSKYTMKSYIEYVRETSERPIDNDIDYFWFGFMILMTPIAAPIYYLGVFADKNL